MEPLIEVKQLSKSYQKKKVVQEVSFNIYEGEILCFLGPNGAAKSTTINILCGLLCYDQGTILFQGEALTTERKMQRFKNYLGVVPQEISIYEELSAEKNVSFFASLYGISGHELKNNVSFALKSVGLLAHRKEKAQTFSGGMKRRLNIACAIAHRPKLLIMDEPTVGIDPQSRNHILQSIRQMNEKGMTILYTTHYMEEVEEISSRIIIMDHGNIIAVGTKEQLKNRTNERKVMIDIEAQEPFVWDEFYQIEGIKHVEWIEDQLVITVIKEIENLDYIIGKLVQRCIKIRNVIIQQDNLETVFLDLTGRSLRD